LRRPSHLIAWPVRSEREGNAWGSVGLDAGVVVLTGEHGDHHPQAAQSSRASIAILARGHRDHRAKDSRSRRAGSAITARVRCDLTRELRDALA
jgi:hypothetical protein